MAETVRSCHCFTSYFYIHVSCPRTRQKKKEGLVAIKYAEQSVRILDTEKMEEKPIKRAPLPLYLGLDFSTQQVCNSQL